MSRSVKVGGELKKENTSIEVREYLNRSGGTLAPGDVVILDTTNSTDTELYCTTTTSADDAKVLGMVIEACGSDNGTRVRVLREGPTNLLKVDGTTDIARGDKLSTFTTVKIAAKAAAGSAGWFAYALEAYATNDSSGVIDAYICVGRADSASAGGNTLDQAYDQGGAGSGKAVTVDSGAVALTNNAANNNGVLTVEKSPVGAQSGDLVTVTAGANDSGDCLQFANSGTGKDVDGTGSLWSVTKAGVAGFATVNCADLNAAASGNTALAVDAAGNGTVTIAGTSTGAITLARATDVTGGLTINDTGLTVTAGGQTSTGNETHTVAATTGSGVLIDGSTVTTGNVLRVEADAANLNGGKIINATLDGTSKLSVAEDGAVVIAGTGTGTDALTLTNGDITVTSGDCTLTDGDYVITLGKITVDTTANETSYVKRNQTTTTGPVFEIEETHTGADNAALLVDHNATGAINAIQVTTDGTGYALSLEPSVAGGNGLTVVTAASGTGRAVFVDGTTGAGWLGTGTEGLVEIANDGAQVADAALLHIRSSGQPSAANDGVCLEIVESGAAQATSYALRIASTNNEALHVDTGIAVFDEAVTLTGGANVADSVAVNIGAGNDLIMQSDGTNVDCTVKAGSVLTLGDGGTTNYTNIAETGLVTFLGTARRSKKLWFAPDTFVAHTGTPVSTQVGAGSAFGFAFDQAADESITTTFMVPDNWTAASDVTAKIFWAANAAAGDCIWDIISVPLAESEAVAGAGNTDSTTDTTDGTANDLNVTAAVTIGASTEWAAGDLVVLRINRDADNVADTLAADAVFLGIEITYTADRI